MRLGADSRAKPPSPTEDPKPSTAAEEKVDPLKALLVSVPALARLKEIIDKIAAAAEEEKKLLNPFTEKLAQDDLSCAAEKKAIFSKLSHLEGLKSKPFKIMVQALQNTHVDALRDLLLEELEKYTKENLYNALKKYYENLLDLLDKKYRILAQKIKESKLYQPTSPAEPQNFNELRKARISDVRELINNLALWILANQTGRMGTAFDNKKIKFFLPLVHSDRIIPLLKPFADELTTIMLACMNGEERELTLKPKKPLEDNSTCSEEYAQYVFDCLEQGKTDFLKGSSNTTSEEYAQYVLGCFVPRKTDFSSNSTNAKPEKKERPKDSVDRVTEIWMQDFFAHEDDLEKRLDGVLAQPEIQKSWGMNGSVKPDSALSVPVILKAVRDHKNHAKILFARGVSISLTHPIFSKFKDEFIQFYLSIGSFSFELFFQYEDNYWLWTASKETLNHSLKACQFTTKQISPLFYQCIEAALSCSVLVSLEALAAHPKFVMAEVQGHVSPAEHTILAVTPKNAHYARRVLEFLIEKDSIFSIEGPHQIAERLADLHNPSGNSNKLMTNIFDRIIRSKSLPLGRILELALNVADGIENKLTRHDIFQSKTNVEIFRFLMRPLIDRGISFDSLSVEDLQILDSCVSNYYYAEHQGRNAFNAFWSLGIDMPSVAKKSTYPRTRAVQYENEAQVFLLAQLMRAYFSQKSSECQRGVLDAWSEFILSAPMRSSSLHWDFFLRGLKKNKVDIDYTVEELFSTILLACGKSVDDVNPINQIPLKDYCHREGDSLDFIKAGSFCFFITEREEIILKARSFEGDLRVVNSNLIQELEELRKGAYVPAGIVPASSAEIKASSSRVSPALFAQPKKASVVECSDSEPVSASNSEIGP